MREVKCTKYQNYQLARARFDHELGDDLIAGIVLTGKGDQST